MQASNKGLQFIAQREACVLTSHRDTTHLAIGFGINDANLVEGVTITFEEAIAAFLKRIEAEEKSLNIIFKDALLDQHHFDALLSLQWNIGPTKLKGQQRLVSAVEVFCRNKTDKGLRDWAAYQLSHSQFSELTGPFNFSRRCREAIMFIGADYGDLSTLKLWPVGTSPRNDPPDPPEIVPMPVFRDA